MMKDNTTEPNYEELEAIIFAIKHYKESDYDLQSIISKHSIDYNYLLAVAASVHKTNLVQDILSNEAFEIKNIRYDAIKACIYDIELLNEIAKKAYIANENGIVNQCQKVLNDLLDVADIKLFVPLLEKEIKQLEEAKNYKILLDSKSVSKIQTIQHKLSELKQTTINNTFTRSHEIASNLKKVIDSPVFWKMFMDNSPNVPKIGWLPRIYLERNALVLFRQAMLEMLDTILQGEDSDISIEYLAKMHKTLSIKGSFPRCLSPVTFGSYNQEQDSDCINYIKNTINHFHRVAMKADKQNGDSFFSHYFLNISLFEELQGIIKYLGFPPPYIMMSNAEVYEKLRFAKLESLKNDNNLRIVCILSHPQLKTCVTSLLEAYNAYKFVHSEEKLEVIATFVLLMGYLHPSGDGNGRMISKILLQKMLIESNELPVLFQDINKIIHSTPNQLVHLIKQGQSNFQQLLEEVREKKFVDEIELIIENILNLESIKDIENQYGPNRIKTEFQPIPSDELLSLFDPSLRSIKIHEMPEDTINNIIDKIKIRLTQKELVPIEFLRSILKYAPYKIINHIPKNLDELPYKDIKNSHEYEQFIEETNRTNIANDYINDCLTNVSPHQEKNVGILGEETSDLE